MNVTLNNACKLISPDYTHVLEFGVYNGRTIKQLRSTLSNKYELFGFDSFIGLPEDWKGTHHKKGAMSMNGKIPKIGDVTFYKGWFKDTIPQYLNIAQPIALLHIDCDLASSTKDVLYGLNDFIVEGTVIVLDDWSIYHNEHTIGEEQTAFFEWTEDLKIQYEMIPRINNYDEIERQIVVITKNK